MSKYFQNSRRKFLQQTMTSLAAIAAAESGVRPAIAATGRRRHLINIVVEEGWNSHWFHNHFPKVDLSAAPADIQKARLYTTLAPEGTGSHPNGLQLGYAGRALYDNKDIDSMLVWRGLEPAAGHKLGNKLLQHGGPSQYALSYTSVVAMGLAQEMVRPLHYVKVAGSPTSLYTNMGMASGFAVPVCIADHSAFKRLTTVSGSDVGSSRRDLISSTISKLANSAANGAVSFKQSQNLFKGFLNSYQSAALVNGGGMADSVEFKSIWHRYCLNVANAIRDILHSSRQVADPMTGLDTTGEARGLTSASTITARGGVSAEAIDAFIKALMDVNHADPTKQIMDVASSSDALMGLKQGAFGAAMAEFLIKKNLSAVVELGLPSIDAHDFDDEELIHTTITFGMFRELVRGLKALPGEGSASLLDLTTMIMHTEFDRQPWLSVATPGYWYRPGTNHGSTASIMIAGGQGFKTGQVIGDIKDAPGAYGKYAAFTNNGYGGPISIDPRTGAPSTSGSVPSTKSLFPTVLAAFGIEVPISQISDFVAVRGVLK